VKVLDLFSGIGGFSLGLERAGMKTVAFCEIDPFCQRVLRKHWGNDIPIHSDIRELKGEHVGPVGLVAASWPCQPFSHAGKRRGEEDDRYLWPEVARILKELRPDWFLGENVTGVISMGLDKVLLDLDDLGYASRAYVIPACAVNAPHRRDRVWVVANSSRVGQSGQGWPIDTSNPAQDADWEEHRTEHEIRRPSKPPVCRGDDGLSRRLDQDRLRALGNAVVPQVVERLGRAIMESSR